MRHVAWQDFFFFVRRMKKVLMEVNQVVMVVAESIQGAFLI